MVMLRLCKLQKHFIWVTLVDLSFSKVEKKNVKTNYVNLDSAPIVFLLLCFQYKFPRDFNSLYRAYFSENYFLERVSLCPGSKKFQKMRMVFMLKGHSFCKCNNS